MLDVGVLAYMDDILVYADTKEKHDNTVREVLKKLQTNGLAVSTEKCVWRTQEVEFLGYVIGRNGIKMSDEKVQASAQVENTRVTIGDPIIPGIRQLLPTLYPGLLTGSKTTDGVN